MHNACDYTSSWDHVAGGDFIARLILISLARLRFARKYTVLNDRIRIRRCIVETELYVKSIPSIISLNGLIYFFYNPEIQYLTSCKDVLLECNLRSF